MIVERADIRRILKGEIDDVLLPGPAPELHSYHAIQPAVGHPRVCTVRVIDAWSHRQGGVVVRFVLEDPPRYLHRSSDFASSKNAPPGYTDDLAYAMRDEEQAVDVVTLSAFAAENRRGDTDRERRRREIWEERSLAERAAELEQLAPLSAADISRELRLAAHALGRAFDKIDRMDRAA